MRRVFKIREFDRWMRKTALTDEALCAAVEEMAAGLVDGDLGGGVLKKRVALPGRGKSAGARTLLATNRESRWFFVHGVEKSERSNITEKELLALKMLAGDLVERASEELDNLVGRQALMEIFVRVDG